ncbi:hypothetical protein WL278_07860 [Staphylococcus caprae]|uniref:hypothetical protein n=1 Tax=Staphylococcus caprae TaxID=29380 RepID=UPI0030BD9292
MSKIKVEKQMTLPELIEYAWENGVRDKNYHSNTDEFVTVNFDVLGHVRLSESIAQLETFAVEVEKEVTETAIFKRLMKIWDRSTSHEGEFDSVIYKDSMICQIKSNDTKAIYNLNDDMTMTLLWKDGAMVDD